MKKKNKLKITVTADKPEKYYTVVKLAFDAGKLEEGIPIPEGAILISVCPLATKSEFKNI